jgi:N6-adenosine-specific RNA methylase IME4
MPKGAAATVASFANNSSTVEHSRKKDELWGIFRGLEADFQK